MFLKNILTFFKESKKKLKIKKIKR